MVSVVSELGIGNISNNSKEFIRAKHINEVSALAWLAKLGAVIIYLGLGETGFAALCGVSLFFLSGIMFLNMKGKQSFTIHFLPVVANITVLSASLYFGKESGAYLFFFLIFVAVWSFFNFKTQLKSTISHAAFTLLCLIIAVWPDFTNNVQSFYFDGKVSANQFFEFHLGLMLIAFFLLLGSAKSSLIRSKRFLDQTLLIAKEKVERSSQAMCILNKKGALLFFNDSFESLFAEIANRSPKRFKGISYHFDDSLTQWIWEKRIDNANHSGEPCAYIDKIKGLKDKVFEIKLQPIKNHEEITAHMVICKNISAKYKNLDKSEIELHTLLSSLGHDLKSPISTLIKLVELTQEEKEPEKIRKYLELNKQSLKKLDNYLGDLLDLSRIEQTDASPKAIELEQMIHDVVDIARINDDCKEVKVDVIVGQNMPFYSEPGRLRQTLHNLISNSFRYSDPLKSNHSVTIKAVVGKENAVIRVSDNGTGIEPRHINFIFKMFYRANKSINGSGLGLYIVKQNVDRLKGQISVNSTPGQGSSFEIIIPNCFAKSTVSATEEKTLSV